MPSIRKLSNHESCASSQADNTRTSQAFEQHALAHIHDLRMAARRYTTRHPHDAEDLVQDTLLRALNAWHSFRPGTDCRAWLMRILANSFVSGYRRRNRERRLQSNPDPSLFPSSARATVDPEAAILDALEAKKVVKAMHQLSPDFAKVIVNADLLGLAYREIAAQLDVPVGTVMSRLHRGRRQLLLTLHSNQDSATITNYAA